MAKTNFVNGTIVTPEFLNSMYQAGGGHVHDGGTEDGHAPKIDLAKEVAGTLPKANLPKVDLAADVVGTLSLERIQGGAALPTNMTQLAVAVETLQRYAMQVAARVEAGYRWVDDPHPDGIGDFVPFGAGMFAVLNRILPPGKTLYRTQCTLLINAVTGNANTITSVSVTLPGGGEYTNNVSVDSFDAPIPVISAPADAPLFVSIGPTVTLSGSPYGSPRTVAIAWSYMIA